MGGAVSDLVDSVGDIVSGVGDAATDVVKSAAPYAGLIGGALGGPMGSMVGSMIGGSVMGSQQRPTYNAQTGQYGYPSMGNVIGGGLGTLGGMMQGRTSKEAIQNAQQQAIQAGQQGAQMAQFRPVGVTTRFGGSQFQVNPTTGQIESAGYNLSPEMKAYQDKFIGLAGQGVSEAQGAREQYAPLKQGAQGLFGLGQQYIAQSPQQVAQDYMKNQLALLQPGREQQSAQTMNQLQQTGRTGLSIAQGGSLGAANPEMQALANARAMQDMQLAAQAQQAGQQNVLFGAGLLGQGAGALGQYYGGQQAAYSPYTSAMGAASGLENLGQNAFTLGTGLGTSAATAGARAGELSATGGFNAAKFGLSPELQYNPWASAIGGMTGPGSTFAQGLGNTLGGWMSGFGDQGAINSAYTDFGGYGADELAGLI